MLAYIYDGSLEGMLTSVFEAYVCREDPDDIVAEGLFQPRLGQETKYIQTDLAQADRVRAGIVHACGRRAYEAVRAVYLSDDPRKGSAILSFVRYAMKRGASALDDLAHPSVSEFSAINKAVYNERHRWQQFMRFREVEGGVYYARCNPAASVVPLLMDWFAARFNTQPFIIYDEIHDIVGVSHEGSWSLLKTDVLDVPPATLAEQEMSRAWKTFYDAVAIESRYNPELRRQFMPRRLWRNITEMQEQLPQDGVTHVRAAPGSACSKACPGQSAHDSAVARIDGVGA